MFMWDKHNATRWWEEKQVEICFDRKPHFPKDLNPREKLVLRLFVELFWAHYGLPLCLSISNCFLKKIREKIILKNTFNFLNSVKFPIAGESSLSSLKDKLSSNNELK